MWPVRCSDLLIAGGFNVNGFLPKCHFAVALDTGSPNGPTAKYFLALRLYVFCKVCSSVPRRIGDAFKANNDLI